MFVEKRKERYREMIEIGIKIGRLRMVEKMKDLGYPIEEIAKITGLSTREIEELQPSSTTHSRKAANRSAGVFCGFFLHSLS